MTSEKVPPQNGDAEQALLGSMLMREAAVSTAVDTVGLEPTDFYLDKHGVIFACIRDLYRSGKPTDQISVADELDARGEAEEADGEHYVSELAAKVPAVGNAKHYASIVLKHALAYQGDKIGTRLREGMDPAEAADALLALSRRGGQAEADGIQALAFSDISAETVKWLWPGRIPLGMLCLLMGDPGLGKSLLTADLAAKVSQAGGHVLLLSAEDHRSATIRPRLEAANADLELVHHVQVRRDGLEDGIALPDDGAELHRLAEEVKARLVIVDPLMAHLPESVNSWSDQAIRRALAPLHRLAEALTASVVIVAHLNKAKGGNALHRTGGSIGIPAAVRSALLLARDPGDSDSERGTQRVLAHVKCNVGPQVESLACEVETVLLDDRTEVPRLTVTGISAVSATDLLDVPTEEARTERDDAIEFLEAELADGARPAKEIKSAANAANIHERTLKRAKADLRVVSAKDGLNGGWTWRLPEGRHGSLVGQGGHDDQGGQPHISTVAPFDSKAISTHFFRGKEGQGGHAGDIGTLAGTLTDSNGQEAA